MPYHSISIHIEYAKNVTDLDFIEMCTSIDLCHSNKNHLFGENHASYFFTQIQNPHCLTLQNLKRFLDSHKTPTSKTISYCLIEAVNQRESLGEIPNLEIVIILS